MMPITEEQYRGTPCHRSQGAMGLSVRRHREAIEGPASYEPMAERQSRSERGPEWISTLK